MLNDMFCLYVPERCLHSEDELHIIASKSSTCFGQKSLTFRGSTYWNMLPVDIKACTSLESFKTALKQYGGFDAQ